jgi:hypothetical protein
MQFTVLHWAVLISPAGWGIDTMTAHFDALTRPWKPGLLHYELGTILEILRHENNTGNRFETFRTDDLLAGFPYCSVGYVGSTIRTAEEARRLGKNPFNSISEI